MEEPSSSDLLFWDLTKKTTKICFAKCIGQVQNKLSNKQEKCIRDCSKRYLSCRDLTLEYIKSLAKQ